MTAAEGQLCDVLLRVTVYKLVSTLFFLFLLPHSTRHRLLNLRMHLRNDEKGLLLPLRKPRRIRGI